MRILLIGTSWHEEDQNSSSFVTGGNIYHTARFLSQMVNPGQIDLITNSSPLISADLEQLKVNLHLLPTSTTPIFSLPMKFQNLEKLTNELPISSFESFAAIIQLASIIVIDLIRPELISFVNQINPKALLIVDAISPNITQNLKKISLLPFLVKMNRPQAATLVGNPIFSVEDLVDSRNLLKSWGIRRAIITLTKEGAFFFDEDIDGMQPAMVITRKTFSLAGNAFLAGVIYAIRITRDLSIITNQGLEKSANYIRQQVEHFPEDK